MQNWFWLQFGHASDFLPAPPRIPSLKKCSCACLLANGCISTAVFILSRRYISCNVLMSDTTALEGVWVLGCTAEQVESMADGGSRSEHRVEQTPPSAVCLLASLCLSMEQLVVVVLHLTMLQAACASLEVLNVLGHVSFSMFVFKSRAARWKSDFTT